MTRRTALLYALLLVVAAWATLALDYAPTGAVLFLLAAWLLVRADHVEGPTRSGVQFVGGYGLDSRRA